MLIRLGKLRGSQSPTMGQMRAKRDRLVGPSADDASSRRSKVLDSANRSTTAGVTRVWLTGEPMSNRAHSRRASTATGYRRPWLVLALSGLTVASGGVSSSFA